MMPGDFFPHYRLSVIYALAGRHQDAISEMQKMLTILEYTELSDTLGRTYKSYGYEKALKFYAKRLETLYSRTGYIPTWYIASIYGFAGDKDQGFAWLQKAYVARDGMDALADPQWDPLRSDPRFKDLVRRVGLPQ
jgi:tetratricopeptide (TPR) repeat protein